MARIVEAIDGRTYSTNLMNNRTGTRTFYVTECPSIDAARVAFMSFGGELLHPDDTSLELVGYDVNSAGGSAVYTITARYERKSIFGGFDVQATYEKMEIDCPMINPVYLTSMTGSFDPVTGQPEMFAALTLGYTMVKVPERRIRRKVVTTWRLSVPDDSGDEIRYTATINELDKIARQDNKIHLLWGRFWKFLGGDARQDPDNLDIYTITYMWELDEGTPAPTGDTSLTVVNPNTGLSSSIDGVLLPNEDRPGDPGEPRYWRPPYTTPYIYSIDAQQRPIYRPIMLSEIDEDGWRQLPGIPEL